MRDGFGEDERGNKGVGCREGGSGKMKMGFLFFFIFWVAG